MNTLIKTALSGVIALTFAVNAQAASDDRIVSEAKAIEKLLGARVGVQVIDTQRNKTWSYRSDERFPMASTFKTLACAALLASGN